jgi:hypothetical protein
MIVVSKPKLKVADEVWIATVLLHRDRPDRTDFSLEEIVQMAEQQNLHGSLRRAFTFTLFSIALRIELQIRADIECSSRLMRVGGVCFAEGTLTIQRGKGAKSRRKPMIYRVVTRAFPAGTKNGVKL